MILSLSIAGGIGALVVLYIAYRRRRLNTSNKPTTPGIVSVQDDHTPGNAVPVKTIQPFKKMSSYINSPWNPLMNAQRVSFYDANNMPRTDIFMPGGGRLPIYGDRHSLAMPISQGHFPVGSSLPGRVIATETPIQVHKTDKNLNHHSTLFHSRLNRK